MFESCVSACCSAASLLCLAVLPLPRGSGTKSARTLRPSASGQWYPNHICLSQAYLPIYQPIPIIPAHIPTIPVHAIPTIPATPALPTLSTCPQTHTCIAMLPSASYLTITRKEGARHAHVPQTHTASTRRPHVPHSRTIWYYVSERRHKGSASPTAN